VSPELRRPNDAWHENVTLADGYDVLALGSGEGYDGGCPCSAFWLDGTRIELHCWRVDAEHDGCGIHFRGDRAVADRIKPLLDAINWYGDWTIVEGLRRG
jgi:hypothetical protein